MGINLVYITCKDRLQALEIGRAVVADRLAACANVLDGMTSLYHWEGKLVEDNECVLILKSQEKHFQALSARVKALHSYAIPCILSLPLEDGNADYLRWLLAEMR